MSTRGNQQNLGEAGGFVTRVEAAARPARLEPGERLRKELEDLDTKLAEEAGKTGEERGALVLGIETKRSERADLLEQARVLTRQADALAPEITELNLRLDALPDETAVRAERARLRLRALGRMLRTDHHAVDEMLDQYALYAGERRTWESKVRSTPELTEDMDLVAYAESSPEAIAELPDVLRAIIEQRLSDARTNTATLPEPARPCEAAPIYECVAPGHDGGSIAMIVIPCGLDALGEHHPEAPLVAEVIAAMCRALIEMTDADAPVIRAAEGEDDPLHGFLLVGARCSTDLDPDWLGVRLLEIFEECHTLGVAVEPVADQELAAALARLVHEKLESR